MCHLFLISTKLTSKSAWKRLSPKRKPKPPRKVWWIKSTDQSHQQEESHNNSVFPLQMPLSSLDDTSQHCHLKMQMVSSCHWQSNDQKDAHWQIVVFWCFQQWRLYETINSINGRYMGWATQTELRENDSVFLSRKAFSKIRSHWNLSIEWRSPV